MTIKSVCVFCGSRDGSDMNYIRAAGALGRALANNDIKLVYGGAAIGMMGSIAKACMSQGGHVLSVVPKILNWADARWDGATEIIETPDLFSRKKVMFANSDAFIGLPGGVGTLDEIFEVMAWSSLKMDGLESKPLFLLNTKGYFNPLSGLFQHISNHGFVDLNDINISFIPDVPNLVNKLKSI